MKGKSYMPRPTALGSGADPLIWLGLAAATLFFVATGAVAYLNFQTLKQDSALVVRTGDTLTALEDVLSTVRDAETGQRGYLLTSPPIRRSWIISPTERGCSGRRRSMADQFSSATSRMATSPSVRRSGKASRGTWLSPRQS